MTDARLAHQVTEVLYIRNDPEAQLAHIVVEVLTRSGAPPTTGPQIWDGAAWTAGTWKVWDGAAWQPLTLQVWDGAAWQPLS